MRELRIEEGTEKGLKNRLSVRLGRAKVLLDRAEQVSEFREFQGDRARPSQIRTGRAAWPAQKRYQLGRASTGQIRLDRARRSSRAWTSRAKCPSEDGRVSWVRAGKKGCRSVERFLTMFRSTEPMLRVKPFSARPNMTREWPSGLRQNVSKKGAQLARPSLP